MILSCWRRRQRKPMQTISEWDPGIGMVIISIRFKVIVMGGGRITRRKRMGREEVKMHPPPPPPLFNITTIMTNDDDKAEEGEGTKTKEEA